jgi:hypothetical protein
MSAILRSCDLLDWKPSKVYRESDNHRGFVSCGQVCGPVQFEAISEEYGA